MLPFHVIGTSRLQVVSDATFAFQELKVLAGIWHSLGFRWAEESFMHTRLVPPVLEDNATADEVHTAWQTWAANETQLRALLGHYILDGQLSAFNRQSPAVRHALNALPFGSSASTFSARNATQWVLAYRQEQERDHATLTPSKIFRTIYLGLFDSSISLDALFPYQTFLSIGTILEGIQSLVCDVKQAEGESAFGVPESSAIGVALSRAYQIVEGSTAQLASSEKGDLLMRWHAVCIDLLCDVPSLGHFLGNLNSSGSISVPTAPSYVWTSTPADRRALLHAIEMVGIAEARSVNSGSPIHLLGSLYLASRLLLGYMDSTARSSNPGSTVLDLASGIDWASMSTCGMLDGNSLATATCKDQQGSNFVLDGGSLAFDGRPFRASYTYISAVSMAKRLGHTFGIAEEFADKLNADETRLDGVLPVPSAEWFQLIDRPRNLSER